MIGGAYLGATYFGGAALHVRQTFNTQLSAGVVLTPAIQTQLKRVNTLSVESILTPSIQINVKRAKSLSVSLNLTPTISRNVRYGWVMGIDPGRLVQTTPGRAALLQAKP